MPSILKLDNRGVIRVSGADNRKLLQGLITSDLGGLKAETALYGALLTPQGKFMFDMIISLDGEDLLLDVEAKRKDDLIRRLMMYRLRADANIQDEPDLAVWAIFDGASASKGHLDPRSTALGHRVIAAENPLPDAAALNLADYERCRIENGVPDGSRDMMVEKYFWLETDAERLNGVSFQKGCYVGQELTARMKHRTSLKKRLMPVQGSDDLSTMAGKTIETDDGKEAGVLHSVAGDKGLAFMRLEYCEKSLFCEDVQIQPITIEATP